VHRLLLIPALATLLVSTQLSAQHGGGHASAGGHGGGMASHGGFGGHMGGGHAFGGMHSGGGAHMGSSFTPRSFGRGSSFRSPLASRTFRGHHHHSGVGLQIRTRDFRNDCFRFGCPGWGFGYPYLGGGIDPYWWWDSGSSYDEDREREIGIANQMNAQSLEEQMMRQQGDQDAYANPDPPQRSAQERADPVLPTILVFRDQHKKEVQNYAIVGQTLWNFASQHTEKIPLSDLDLTATAKANDERGVDFRVPGANEGQ
jgi:hypothetical protein